MFQRKSSINWQWLCFMTFELILTTSSRVKALTESQENHQQNATKMGSLLSNSTIHFGDSDLSASERNRRLIPYMTYLPTPDIFPINAEYAKKSFKQHLISKAASGEFLQAPPIQGAAALPKIYKQIKMQPGLSPFQANYIRPPAAVDLHYHTNTAADSNDNDGKNYDSQKYHLHAVGGIKENINEKPQLFVQPPSQEQHGQTLTAAKISTGINNNNNNDGRTFIAYKPALPNPLKHITVQHFPPLSHQNYQTSSQQLETLAHHVPLYQRQHTKQSKTNLTPFTSENTVPGHFIPIIYTPVSNDGTNIMNNNNNNEQQNNGNTINYGNENDPIPIGFTIKEQERQQTIKQKNAQPQTASYYMNEQQQYQTHASSGQLVPQYITATALELAAHPNSSRFYHHVPNEPTVQVAVPGTSSILPPSPPIISNSKNQQHHQYQHHQKQALSLEPHQYQHTQIHNTEPQTHLHEEQITPQEKYVMYLHQRISYQKQQQHAKEQYLHQQQQKNHHHVYMDVETTTRKAVADPANPPPPLQQLYKNIRSKVIQNNAIDQQSMLHTIQNKQKLELPITQTSNRRPQSNLLQEPHQQVLHIPLRALFGNLYKMQLDKQNQQLQQPKYHASPLQQLQIPNNQQQIYKDDGIGGPNSPQKYIDYVIEEPKQSLDEAPAIQIGHSTIRPAFNRSHLYNIMQPLAHLPKVVAPQHEMYYFVSTTVAPQMVNSPQPGQQIYLPTQQTHINKETPTLRLQPVMSTFSSARHPVINVATPKGHPSVTSSNAFKNKYFPIKTTPQPTHKDSDRPIVTSANSIKLKSSNNYALPGAPPKEYTSLDFNDVDLPDIHTSSLTEILHKLQASNHLPKTLTPDNIDNSIRTLIRILQNLKQTKTLTQNTPEHYEQLDQSPPKSETDDYSTTGNDEVMMTDVHEAGHYDTQLPSVTPNKHPGPSTGRPGIDFPNYAIIPQTSFDCMDQRYKGFFGDPETNCQVWHYCDLNGGKASFLCPNGTIFSQIALTCDWWFNVKCSTTAQLYVLNERLYKYILPFTPKFPEDYNGPIVDKYLAMKFQEMEEKMRLEKLKKDNQMITTTEPQIEDDVDVKFVTIEHTDNSTEHNTITTDRNKAQLSEQRQHLSINSQVGEQSSERNLLIDDEIDDISERGTFDTYQSISTTTMTPLHNSTKFDRNQFETKEIPLSLKPIVVVSSTPEPYQSEDDEDYKLQTLRDTENQQSTPKQTNERTKVSVEKVEVIEIKTDGNTGQLMPIQSGINQSAAQDDKSTEDLQTK